MVDVNDSTMAVDTMDTIVVFLNQHSFVDVALLTNFSSCLFFFFLHLLQAPKILISYHTRADVVGVGLSSSDLSALRI